MTITDQQLLALSEKNLNQAVSLGDRLGIVAAWESVGATVNRVGSVRTGLLMTHLDMDFHIYTPTLDIDASFTAVNRIARLHSVKTINYINLIGTDEECLEWHAYVEDESGQTWQIDMIHMAENSPYNGYFEGIADKVAASLTPETKLTILRLKYMTPPEEKIFGICYPLAVIRDGVRTWEEFTRWRADNPCDGILEW